jgi:required for meiotic nuclear division protein 1
LKAGRAIKLSQSEVLRKTGELFALRHMINLRSDLLDTPDFYWDREHLEPLYMRVISNLSIQKRTRVMNERLSHCLELVELLSAKLSDRHHVRLEWMIIVLIMVEVAFEFLHYSERIFGQEAQEAIQEA